MDGPLTKSLGRKDNGEYNNKGKKDRLPIKVTHESVEELLGFPELENGAGFSIADAVYKIMEDWNQLNKVECCCVDTTSANTRCWQGTAVRLEQWLNRSLMYVPCLVTISLR